MTRIGMLIFDDAEELDFVGPWEVFTMAGKQRPELEVLLLERRLHGLRLAGIDDHRLGGAFRGDQVGVVVPQARHLDDAQTHGFAAKGGSLSSRSRASSSLVTIWSWS